MSAAHLRPPWVALVFAVCSWAEFSAHADLVVHWRLDEGSGDVFADSVAGNDGFLPVNLPANVPFAPEDVAIEWVTDDGPPGIQDTSVRFLGIISYIETPFEGIGGDNPRTITAWVKAPPPANHTAIVSWGPASGAGRKWHFKINPGTNSLRTEYASGQNYAETDMADEQWHFVASVFPEGAEFGSEIIHYLDGEEDGFLGGTDQPIDTLIGDAGDSWPQFIDGLDVWPVLIGFGPCCPDDEDRSFDGQIADLRIYDEALDEDALRVIMEHGGGDSTKLQPGDADMDLDFDQLDLVKVQIAAKYLTGQPATWGEGDWDGAPGGEPGNPPPGDGVFDQLDIIAALGAGNYLTNLHGATLLDAGDTLGDDDLIHIAVPEPVSVLLLILGLLAVAGVRPDH